MNKSGQVKKGVLFALGNPLLDITAKPSAEFLNKYDLKANDAILAQEKHYSMYDDMLDKYPVEYSAGGSVQNASRVFQWAIGVPEAVTYAGCIGNDKFGDTLTSVSKAAGVNVQYMRHSTESTGTCAVLVTGVNRSLCAYLGAANFFQKSHLEKPDLKELISLAHFFYIEGYHLTVSIESILHLAEHAASHDKVFCMNLNAPYIVKAFRENMMKALPYVDIIISNEAEAEAFADEHKLGTKDLREIALRFVKLSKVNGKRQRLVVITQGKLPVIVANGTNVVEFPVPEISEDKVVDTNGAGDGFAGGFLAMYVKDKPLDVCVRCGIYAASEIIQRDGCTLPTDFRFEE